MSRGRRGVSPASDSAPTTVAAGESRAAARGGALRYLPYAVAALLCAGLTLRWFLAMGPATDHEIATFCVPLHPDAANPTLGHIPTAAPDVAALNIDGKMTRISAYRGKVVVLNFFATWCPPCREEMPGVLKLADELASDPDVVVIGVSDDHSWSDVSKYFRSIGVTHTPMTLLLDPDGVATHAFGTHQLPETYVLDPSGQVRYYFANVRDFGDPATLRCIESVRAR